MAIVAPPMKQHINRFALAVCAVLTSAAGALAQISDEVTVNPDATGRVLLYPGGKYGRVQRPLLEPGARDPYAPIVLHMPRKHRRHLAAVAKSAPAQSPVAQTAPENRASKARVAKTSPPAPQNKAAPPPMTRIPDESAATMFLAPPPKAAAASQKPAAVARAEPPPARPSAAAPPVAAARNALTDSMELSKRNSILFAPGAEEPPASALDAVRALTASLTAALWSGTAHIQLEAFGGKPNDKSSDARRLSLKRALIIRQLLIDDGIPSERIVVRAMGGASDGAPDRVDIFVAA